jgi:hypothetical protein
VLARSFALIPVRVRAAAIKRPVTPILAFITLMTASYIRTDSVAKATETGSCNKSMANVPIVAIATIATQAATKARIPASCSFHYP